MSSCTSQPERVTGKIESVDALTASDQQQLLGLMRAYYTGFRDYEFARDLSEKQWVITLRGSGGDIHGFSTQVLLQIPDDPDAVALFSGDTVVAEPYRSNHLLAGLWGALALELLESYPNKQLFWFLISKGYKTYRYLPLFFKDYFPHRGAPMPVLIAEKMSALAREKFGDRYDVDRKLVRAKRDGCRLRPDVAPVDSQRLRNPDVQFFVEANPRHAEGDELCCMAPIRRDNFTAAAYRVIKAAAKSVGA
jgi:hypothetical protein